MVMHWTMSSFAGKTPTAKRIGIGIQLHTTGGRSFFLGAAKAIHERPEWALVTASVNDPQKNCFDASELGRIPIDGYITFNPSAQIRKRLRELGIPTVALGTDFRGRGFRSLYCSPTEVAREAAAYLCQEGFRRFAFVGEYDRFWKEAVAVFSDTVTQMSGESLEGSFALVADGPNKTRTGALREWLADLPKPVVLFCKSQHTAQLALKRCHDLGLSIPDQVAIMGAWHDPFLNAIWGESVTSIIRDDEGMGRKAVYLLDDLFRRGGAKAPALEPEVVPPAGVYPGRSTTFVASDDPLVARALSLINEEWDQFLTAEEVARRLGVGQRTLTTRFKADLRKTLYQEIIAARMEHARRLLLEKDSPVEELALRCGYEAPHHFIMTFKKFFGLTPFQYRRAMGQEKEVV